MQDTEEPPGNEERSAPNMIGARCTVGGKVRKFYLRPGEHGDEVDPQFYAPGTGLLERDQSALAEELQKNCACSVKRCSLCTRRRINGMIVLPRFLEKKYHYEEITFRNPSAISEISQSHTSPSNETTEGDQRNELVRAAAPQTPV